MKRHIQERHSAIEHWRCTVDGCTSKFIRRNYLSRHLILRHEYSAIEARELALSAPRGDLPTQNTSYYEDVSGDDSTLDILAELDELRHLQQPTDTPFSVDDYLSDMECSVSIGDANLLDISVSSVDERERDVSSSNVTVSSVAVEEADVRIADEEERDVISAADNVSSADVEVADVSSAVENVSNTDVNDRDVSGSAGSVSTDADDRDNISDLNGEEDDRDAEGSCGSGGKSSESVTNQISDISDAEDDVIVISDTEDDTLVRDSARRVVRYWTYTIRKIFTYTDDGIHEQMDTSIDIWSYNA